jgi:cytoskeletal protein RodZ
VASFGENLRQARKARNITLQEIAAATKISSRALQALEDEHFDQLPGGIFNKGFVRAYARCVGLDEEATIAEYLNAAKVSPSEIDMEVMSTQVAAAAGAREPWTPNAATVVGVLAVIVALGMGALWLNEHRKEARSQMAASKAENATTAAAPLPALPQTASAPEPNPPLQSAGNAADSTASQGTTTGTNQENSGASTASASTAAKSAASPAASQPTQSTNQTGKPPVGASATAAPVTASPRTDTAHSKAPVEVSISANARVWISVSSDGTKVETVTLDPEKPDARNRSYSAKEKLRLDVGNPAGLSVTYNGKPAGVLGHSGERATIMFTPEGMAKQ